MTNNNQLTRIERGAKEYADKKYSIKLQAVAGGAYLDGYEAAIERAAPVVKALERIKNFIPASDYEVLIHVEQILETYNADV